MSADLEDNVDYRLLNKLSNLVICSQCLRRGKVTPVPQIIDRRRPPTNRCADCRTKQIPQGMRGGFGKLLRFPR